MPSSAAALFAGGLLQLEMCLSDRESDENIVTFKFAEPLTHRASPYRSYASDHSPRRPEWQIESFFGTLASPPS